MFNIHTAVSPNLYSSNLSLNPNALSCPFSSKCYKRFHTTRTLHSSNSFTRERSSYREWAVLQITTKHQSESTSKSTCVPKRSRKSYNCSFNKPGSWWIDNVVHLQKMLYIITQDSNAERFHWDFPEKTLPLFKEVQPLVTYPLGIPTEKNTVIPLEFQAILGSKRSWILNFIWFSNIVPKEFR